MLDERAYVTFSYQSIALVFLSDRLWRELVESQMEELVIRQVKSMSCQVVQCREVMQLSH
jgi:hypothetical protein